MSPTAVGADLVPSEDRSTDQQQFLEDGEMSNSSSSRGQCEQSRAGVVVITPAASPNATSFSVINYVKGIITVARFMNLTEDITVRSLGLSVGDWMDIQKVQERFSTLETSTQQPAQPPLSMQLSNGLIISVEGVREVLATSNILAVQELFNGKLHEGAQLSLDDKRLISRTLCGFYFFDMIKNKVSVPLDAKLILAKCICQAYDCLTTEDTTKPPEADWFYKNNGDSKGAHTGFIQNWIKNNMKPFRTKNKKRKGTPAFTAETAAALEELEELSCEPENWDRAVQLVQSTFDCRDFLRSQKDHCSALLTEYRKLLAFDGNLIKLEFALMYPQEDPLPSLAQVGPLCLMLSDDFNDIACEGIRMCMIIMQQLKHRGVALQQNTDNLPPLEDEVATFVRFQQAEDEDLEEYRSLSEQTGPLIVCGNLAFAEGLYTLFIDGESVCSNTNFYAVLEIWFKSHHVFGFKYPTKAAPTMQFMELVPYNMKPSRRANSVNAFAARIRKSLKALPSN